LIVMVSVSAWGVTLEIQGPQNGNVYNENVYVYGFGEFSWGSNEPSVSGVDLFTLVGCPNPFNQECTIIRQTGSTIMNWSSNPDGSGSGSFATSPVPNVPTSPTSPGTFYFAAAPFNASRGFYQSNGSFVYDYVTLRAR